MKYAYLLTFLFSISSFADNFNTKPTLVDNCRGHYYSDDLSFILERHTSNSFLYGVLVQCINGGMGDSATSLDEVALCTAPGLHAPTARDLANWAKANGAAGTLETSQIKNGIVPPGYYLIEARNLDGSTDKFYYNNEGYKKPKGVELSLGKIVSPSTMSVRPGESEDVIILVDNGAIGANAWATWTNAMCVLNQ